MLFMPSFSDFEKLDLTSPRTNEQTHSDAEAAAPAPANLSVPLSL